MGFKAQFDSVLGSSGDKTPFTLRMKLYFVDIIAGKDHRGKPIAYLTLKTPIPVVKSPGGKAVYNVVNVAVHYNDYRYCNDFEFDSETDKGVYEGDSLSLHVGKFGRVWMRMSHHSLVKM